MKRTAPTWLVAGRGELHLGVLIEQMQEGYELQVSQPEVIIHRDANGKATEPYEELTIRARNRPGNGHRRNG